MPNLPTWGGRSEFEYDGTVQVGTDITFGRGWHVRVEAHHYVALRQHFMNQGDVPVGTSRTDAPANSIGAWLKANVDRRAIASYVAPILVHEGYAERVGNHNILVTG